MADAMRRISEQGKD